VEPVPPAGFEPAAPARAGASSLAEEPFLRHNRRSRIDALCQTVPNTGEYTALGRERQTNHPDRVVAHSDPANLSLRTGRQHRKPLLRKQFQQLPVRIPDHRRAAGHRPIDQRSAKVVNLL
jgi:hypothetical protein